MNRKTNNYDEIQTVYMNGERVRNTDGMNGTVTIQNGKAVLVAYDGGIEYSLPETIHTIYSIEDEKLGRNVDKYA